jgi:hypothetical protein
MDRRAMTIVTIAFMLAACGDTSSHTTTSAMDAVDVDFGRPEGKAVLTVTGKLDETNQGPKLVLGMEQLEMLPPQDIAVFEPFRKEDSTFSGVDVRDLLTSMEVEDDAETVRMIALDDYEVELEVEMLEDGGVLIATREAGSRIPIERGGPIRLIFPPDNEVGQNTDLWIWSLRSIEVI